jgi:Asp/Glu/hydantoin racemase
MAHIQIINPNTSVATTTLMLEIARSCVPGQVALSGLTVTTGAQLIVDPDALAAAADAVLALEPMLSGDGVIVAAYGDPGADELRRRLRVPVVGIGEASLRAAAAKGRFSIVTTTPRLEASIRARVAHLGLAGQLASIRISSGDPALLTADAGALETALEALVVQCRGIDGAEAVVIGGGPLSRAARAIAERSPVAIIEPLPAAVRWMLRALGVAS